MPRYYLAAHCHFELAAFDCGIGEHGLARAAAVGRLSYTHRDWMPS